LIFCLLPSIPPVARGTEVLGQKPKGGLLKFKGLHHCTTAPLHHCTIAPLHHCTIAGYLAPKS